MTKIPIFSPSFGNRPSYLVGRDEVIARFMDGLSREPGNRERAMVMLGQRGSGKTVLLWELADRAAAQGFVVASPTVVAEGMLGRIVEKIQESGEAYIKQDGRRVSGGSVGALGFSVGLQFTREIQETKSFEFKLKQLARELTKCGHGILILIDELQANSEEVRQLVIAYQELVGEGLDVALVMAGLPGAVSATLNDRVLTFLNRARKVTLAPLSFSEVDSFYQRAFSELGVHISEEARASAARATFGSPYMLQLIGYNVALRVPSGGMVDADVLDSSIAASKEDYENDVCRTTLAALSGKDVEFLGAMALDDGPSKMKTIAQRLGVTSDYAQKYRKRLIDAGVIESRTRGEVSFAVPLLADYLRSEAW